MSAAVAAAAAAAVSASFASSTSDAHTSRSTYAPAPAPAPALSHNHRYWLGKGNGLAKSKLTEAVETRRRELFVARVNEIVGNGVSGILYKWINYVKGWKPRWFVLQDGVLSYYEILYPDGTYVSPDTTQVIGRHSGRFVLKNKHQNSQLPVPKPLGVIHLRVLSVEESESDDVKFTIFTGSKMLYLRARSYLDRAAWVRLLTNVKRTFPRIQLMPPPVSNQQYYAKDDREETDRSGMVGMKEIVAKGLSGILYKWINYVQGWQPRWFLLKDGVLSYHKINGPGRIYINPYTIQSQVIGAKSAIYVKTNKHINSHLRPPRPPLGEVHLKVSLIQESSLDDKEFTIFTGTKMLHLRAESYADRVAWVGPLKTIKSMVMELPATVSAEQLRLGLVDEDEYNEYTEQIMESDFILLQKRILQMDRFDSSHNLVR